MQQTIKHYAFICKN